MTFQPCEHENCPDEGSACWLPDNTDPEHPSAYYCSDHAYDAGFCWGCGQFYGGFEWFDFANPSRLCTECAAEYADEMGMDDNAAAWEEYYHDQP